jgi:hypothetical protein
MKKLSVLTIALLSLFVAREVRAWNNIGHASIACIAERHLTPEARERYQAYFKHTMAYHASWMDYWRNCPGFEETHYWHGVVVDEQNNQIKGDTRNAAYQIKRICKQMRKYHRLKDSIVCDNIKYLVHMVGDMHCPVHVKYNSEPQYKQRSLLRKGKKLSFHAFWDSAIGYYNKGMTCDAIAEKYDTLSDEEIAAICAGTPDDWNRVNAEEMREIYSLIKMGGNEEDIPEENHERMKEIAMRQMLRGGYRLAHVMNTIFSK